MAQEFDVVLPKWDFIRFTNNELKSDVAITGIFPREGYESLEAILPPSYVSENSLYLAFFLKDIPVYYRKLENGQYQWEFKYSDNMNVIFRYEDIISYNGPVDEEEYALFHAEFHATPILV